jgi:ABC-type transporter Mla MlaB component
MLRILNTVSPATTTLHLEGKLLRPWIPEVEASINAAMSQGALRVNLAHLQFADESGLHLLHSLQRQHIELVGVPALIEALLRRTDDTPHA